MNVRLYIVPIVFKRGMTLIPGGILKEKSLKDLNFEFTYINF